MAIFFLNEESGITEEMAKRAAKIARIDDFIENLPEGYSTIIGERGVQE